MKKTIYVISPYSAPTRLERERNINDAEVITGRIIDADNGWAPIAVQPMLKNLEDRAKPEWFYSATLEIMRRCDAVIWPWPDYHLSSGCEAELKEARRLGMPIYKSVYDLPEVE